MLDFYTRTCKNVALKNITVDIHPPDLTSNKKRLRQYSIIFPNARFFYFTGATSAKRAASKLGKELTNISFEFNEILSQLHINYHEIYFYIPIDDDTSYAVEIAETTKNLHQIFSRYGQRSSYNAFLILERGVRNGTKTALTLSHFCEHHKLHVQKKRLQYIASRFKSLLTRLDTISV